uniref:Bola-like protein n=1 Tax=Psilocybe cubensis TaxID=181762 RepID=A0A8H7Y1J3_PSICU
MNFLSRRLLSPQVLSIRRSWLSTTATWSSATSATASTAPPGLSEGEQVIHEKLTAKFAPSQLQVQDVSGGCGTFYAITIASSAFKGLPIVKQHKLVTEALKADIEGFHGLQIKTIST